MGKYFVLFRLGLKYLYRYRRRYGFLFAALVFGFTIVTLITTINDGMTSNVYYVAQSHYAGDIVALGYEHGTYYPFAFHLNQNEIQEILQAAAPLNSRYTVRRTLSGDNGIIYFNGMGIPLKYVIGSEWEEEEHLFNKITFSGSPVLPFGDDGIIISSPVAARLGARLGDSIILEVETRWGQRNTGTFIVKGIIWDSSIFGYFKVYISRLSLNRLIDFEDGDCSSIGFFFDKPGIAERERKRLQGTVEARIQTGPLVYNRDELDREINKPWEGTKIFLFTMPVYLSDVADLLGAMTMIAYFTYGMMLIIILVSAVVTYRLIFHERTREMGIMRAMGFYGGDLHLVLWTEVFVLALVSLLAGLFLVWILNHGLSFLSFSWFPSFEIFLKDGKLKALYLPGTMLVNIISFFLVLFAAAWVPSFRSSRKALPDLLSGEPL